MAHDVERYHPDLSHSDLLCGLSSLENRLRQPDAKAPAVRDLDSALALAACVGQFEARPVADVAEANPQPRPAVRPHLAAVTVTTTKGEPR